MSLGADSAAAQLEAAACLELQIVDEAVVAPPLLHVRCDEGSGPAIVLLHGLGSDSSVWREVIGHIGPGYRCIAIDLLGFGASPAPLEIDYSAADHVRSLHATLQTLNLHERFILVGHCLGGEIALHYAAKYPSELRRLVLLSTPFRLPSSAFGKRHLGSMFFEEAVCNPFWKLLARRPKRRGVVYDIASGRLEDYARAYVRSYAQLPEWPIVAKNLTGVIAPATFVDELARAMVPVVYATGVRDPLVQPEQLPVMSRLRQGITVRRIFGKAADHFVVDQMPDKTAREILKDEVHQLNVALRSGSGDPFVLLHDHTHGAECFAPLAAGLSADAEVVALDLLGFGGSPRPQACDYLLADHVASVLNTLDSLFPGRRVRLVGSGLGATIALECAAMRPTSVNGVVAFSPVFGKLGCQGAADLVDPLVAEASGAYWSVLASERIERTTIPAIQAVTSALAVDECALVPRVTVPVRFVLPADCDSISKSWLQELIAPHPHIELFEPPGPDDFVFSRPAEAAVAVGGVSKAQIFAASSANVVSPASRRLRLALLGGPTDQMLRLGLLLLVTGLLTASAEGVGLSSLLATALLSEAALQGVGAWGLKRNGCPWMPWLGMSVLSATSGVVFSVASGRAPATSLAVVALLMLYRSIATAYAAVLSRGPHNLRSALWINTALGVVFSLLTGLLPVSGSIAPHLLAGCYLAASGAVMCFFSWRESTAARRRIVGRVARIVEVKESRFRPSSD